MKLSQIVFFAIILTCSRVWSHAPVLQNILNKTWYSHYTPLACSDNMMRLLSELEPDFKRKAQIVHLSHVHMPHRPVIPNSSRQFIHNGAQSRWVFHAFIIIDQLVMDYDFGAEAKVLNVLQYLNEMWPSIVKNPDDFQFQIKPALEYTKYDSDGLMEQGRDFLSLDDFLECTKSSFACYSINRDVKLF